MQSGRKIIPEWLLVLSGCAVIAALGLYLFNGVSDYMDILLSDETFYLAGGLNFLDKIPKGFGPSYSGWYFVLSLFENDPVRLHYLNFKLLAIAYSLLVFLVLYRLKVPMILAFACGLFFVFCDINMISWPRISHFAAIGLLLALFLSTYLKSFYLKFLLFLFAGLMVTYARPEIKLSFNIALLGFIVYFLFVKRFRLNRWEWGATIVMLPVFAVFFMKIWMPMLPPKGSPNLSQTIYPRQITAFGQHYYLRYMEENGLMADSMIYWDKVMREDYEPQISLAKMLLSNKPATTHHVWYNTRAFVKRSFDYTTDVILPNKILHFPVWLKFLLVAGGISAVIALGGWAAYRRRILDNIRAHGADYGLVALFSFPPVLTSLIIYPRDHYLMLLIPVYLLLMALLLLIHGFRGLRQRTTLIAMAALTLFAFLLGPKPANMTFFDLWQERTSTVNLDAIHKINEFPKGEPYAIMNDEGLIDVYLEDDSAVAFFAYGNMGGLTFDQMKDTINIKVVHMTTFMEHDPGLVHDTTWARFLKNPQIHNFTRVETGSRDGYLLVHESMLQP